MSTSFKKVYTSLLIVLLILGNACILHSQQAGSDTNNHIPEEASARLYNEYALVYIDRSPEKSLEFANKALFEAYKSDNKQEEAQALFNQGEALFSLSRFDQALSSYKQAIKHFEYFNNRPKLAQTLLCAGLSCHYLGNNADALQFLQDATVKFTELNDQNGIAKCLQNLGIVNADLKNHEKAHEYYLKALEINERLDNRGRVAALLQNIGIVHYHWGKHAEAEDYYKRALRIFRQLDDKEGIASTLNNMGLFMESLKRYPEALDYYQQTLAVFESIDYKTGIAIVLFNLGSVHKNMGNHEEAIRYYERSREISREYHFNHITADIFVALSDIHAREGDYKSALSYYQQHVQYKDSLSKDEALKQITELETRFGIQLKEQELTRKTDALRKQKVQIYILIGGFCLLALLSILTYIAYEKKSRTETELNLHREKLEELVETRTRELQTEMMERKVAEESDRLKTAFLANMSHEIRTPMNSIIAFSNFLKNPGLTDTTREEYLNYINSCGTTLLQLIDDIIDTARIEARQIKIKRTKCYLNKLITELYTGFKETGRTKNRDIEFRIRHDNIDQNYCIYTDQIRLKQILNNLIDNSLKFTDAGFIEFGFEQKYDHTLLFYVKDTGIGIPEDKKEIIFERFGQADNVLNKNIRGTGLGLAISKNLAELLGGRIWVDSISGMGSTFYFTIPYNHLEITNIETLPDIVRENPRDVNLIWKDKTILIAEDEDLNYKVMEVALQRTQAQLIRAVNGREALDHCRENLGIDLVLMDIQMPVMDGLEATRWIKEIRYTIPIIAQTAFAMPEEKEKCLKAGCDDYLSKPIDLNELFDKIQKYLA
jgi:signal transduction histidine kinase